MRTDWWTLFDALDFEGEGMQIGDLKTFGPLLQGYPVLVMLSQSLRHYQRVLPRL